MASALDRIGRWFRQAELGLNLGARLGAGYIRFVNWTTRWRTEGSVDGYHALARGAGVVVVGWHGRLFLSPVWVPAGVRAVAMISANRDGELIARLVSRFGVETARGSSHDHRKRRDKGGARAYVTARRALQAGRVVLAISPDGPRGPRMRVQPGAAQIAVETQTPVQPVTFSARWAITTRGWDRFMVPFPFGRGVQILGEVLHPPAENTPESVAAFGQRIEAALIAITRRADEMCGRTPIDPAPSIGQA